MASTKKTLLICDVIGCRSRYGDDHHFEDANVARWFAQAAGWKRVKLDDQMHDLCASHSKSDLLHGGKPNDENATS